MIIGGKTSSLVPTPPPSIITPSAGTSLILPWSLQGAGATGPRTAFTNGTWSGSIDAYLSSKGFVISNAGYLWKPSGTLALGQYNFQGAPPLAVGPDVLAVIDDCYFPTNGVAGPMDTNGNITTSNPCDITLNFCDFNSTVWNMQRGSIRHNRCLVRNQVDILGFCGGFAHAPVTYWEYLNCDIPGIGCNPPSLPTPAHVEAVQDGPTAPGSSFLMSGNIIRLANGQATLPDWGSGYTALTVSSVGDLSGVFEDNVVMNVEAVNANVLHPNAIGCIIAYDNSWTNITIRNNAWESGVFGYTKSQTGGSNRLIDGGGNRDFITNLPVTSASPGWA